MFRIFMIGCGIIIACGWTAEGVKNLTLAHKLNQAPTAE